jgi:hypothetical protein
MLFHVFIIMQTFHTPLYVTKVFVLRSNIYMEVRSDSTNYISREFLLYWVTSPLSFLTPSRTCNIDDRRDSFSTILVEESI